MLTQEQKTLIGKIADLRNNSRVCEALKRAGYTVSNLVWEDTSRFKGSCWGNNISDMTLILAHNHILLPMIRSESFNDKTYDVLMDLFNVPVYDERKGRNAEKKVNNVVRLSDFIQNIKTYVPDIKIKGSLFLPRDVHVLTSPQVCVLPLKDGSVDFAVQMYNYQSQQDSPAVLVITVCQQGVSVQIMQGQEILYFNDNGKAAWMNAVRLEDDRKAKGEKVTKVNSIKEMSANELDAKTILVIQIPLKQVKKYRSMGFGSALGSSKIVYESAYESAECADEESADEVLECARGMDYAQVKKGSHTGDKYKGVGVKELERDPDSPIRVTIQDYIVTDTAELTDQNIGQIVEMLHRMEKFAEAKGSLVTTTSDRLTEPGQIQQSPFGAFKPQPVVDIAMPPAEEGSNKPAGLFPN